MTLQTSWY